MRSKIPWTLIMTRALTSRTQATHQRGATLLDMEGVRNGEPHATHLFILIYWKQLMKLITYKATITILLIYILMQGIYHAARSATIWIYYMCQNKHTRQKSLRMYMRCWRSRLARLNNMFDSYIKENYKVVDYYVKTPSLREHCLTWKPYGYYKRIKSRVARSRCIALFAAVIIEARPAMSKERKTRMEFGTDSFARPKPPSSPSEPS